MAALLHPRKCIPADTPTFGRIGHAQGVPSYQGLPSALNQSLLRFSLKTKGVRVNLIMVCFGVGTSVLLLDKKIQWREALGWFLLQSNPCVIQIKYRHCNTILEQRKKTETKLKTGTSR